MQVRDPQAVLRKLEERNLKIDSFFLRRTGFIANQTLLKLGEYNLNCVPATIGMGQARFLVALSASEISHFAKFKEGNHLLMLTFEHPDQNDVARYPIRVSLQEISPVPDRKGVCFLLLKLKSMPTEFLLFLGDFFEELDAKIEAWEKLSAETLPYDSPAVLIVAEHTAAVQVTDFHTKRLGLAAEAPEGAGSLKLMYQGRPLNLAGTWNGKDAFVPEFNPDWLDFVEQAHLRRDFKKLKMSQA